MMKVMKKFGGALMLYAVIFFGIVAICSRVNGLNQESEEVIDYTVAVNHQ
mgnify:CR=1 FL=1